eukprot:CAMPEP_0117055180 /NCGR_PEP_ID=MMETSP0472-20121206/38246_1 /TAXON_ID=693140 ORGANISM="Tiarina fusus, Strain LIS" /NCGR_SAMPLE_ID=MMETSP0472 /ASSEMBLY_ACC=CAM_ASM_000603 /LENGTH=75 /DNA_ID=CAMNT_0004771063 /DNA_START=128 /DNA_END=352 /DNA_ORIENTATION=-
MTGTHTAATSIIGASPKVLTASRSRSSSSSSNSIDKKKQQQHQQQHRHGHIIRHSQLVAPLQHMGHSHSHHHHHD